MKLDEIIKNSKIKNNTSKSEIEVFIAENLCLDEEENRIKLVKELINGNRILPSQVIPNNKIYTELEKLEEVMHWIKGNLNPLIKNQSKTNRK